jgi:uncharacterized membrane protein YhaH (DUF805 family)
MNPIRSLGLRKVTASAAPERLGSRISKERKRTMEWYLMVWKKYAEFDGRSRRKEYWMFTLFNTIAIFLVMALAFAGIALSHSSGSFLFIPVCIYALAALIPSISVATRRFHDVGKSGWMLLLLCVLGIIPIVGFICAIIQLVLLCQDSQPGVNQYGPNPKFPELGAMMYAGNAGFVPANIAAPPQPFAVEVNPGFCKSCGAKLADGAPFCTQCGTHV